MKWTNDEINFLKENYEQYGAMYCSKNLNKNLNSIRSKANDINLKLEKFNFYTTTEFKKLIKESNSLTDVCIKMNMSVTGGNRQTIKKYIKIYNIDISHFCISTLKTNFPKKNLEDILVENSTYGTTYLKERLYNEGIKERKCELCGQDEIWNGKHMSLILDHINGVHDDHRLENLRIVCPNCNATLDTFSGKNVKQRISLIYKDNKKKKYCSCGKQISLDAMKCQTCDSLFQRKIERPPYDQLLHEINELGYRAVGRKYGVSDNAIRKWKKYYENNPI